MKLSGNTTKLALISVGLVAAIVAYQNYDVLKTAILGRSPGPALSPEAKAAVSAAVAPPPRAAGPRELALVAPLVKGSMLLDYEVTAIYGVETGAITVLVAKDEGLVYLSVAMNREGGAKPPIIEGQYALFSSIMKAPEPDAARLLLALSEIVKSHADVPTPPGLSAFAPGPMPAPPR